MTPPSTSLWADSAASISHDATSPFVVVVVVRTVITARHVTPGTVGRVLTRLGRFGLCSFFFYSIGVIFVLSNVRLDHL